MGPIWFYEGFAIFAADQLKKSEFKLNSKEIWETIENTERGSYIKYGFVFRYFVDKIGLKKLISKSSDKDFHKWLKQQIN
ncbi:MAG: hypothetical protein A2046_06835 [Bacteroidetes bacterium GWA2_30_7]|nr:MAG: hypothetical protein A2046_06835 [Bacteroidetes bacterium GWA2_30_7]